MPSKLAKNSRDEESNLEKDLEKIRNQKPSLPTISQLKVFVDKENTNRKEKEMKNINWKGILETVKTITIVALVAGVVGFMLGVKYQEQKTDQVDNRISNQIKQLKESR